MEYDKTMLTLWAEMETWDQFLERNGALNKHSSREGFKYVEGKYFKEVRRRINCCKRILAEHEDAEVHYTLAQLYDRCNLDESVENLYKRKVRFHCIKAIRRNTGCAASWALLAECYLWIVCLGGESKNSMPTMQAMIGKDITVDIEQKDPQSQKRVLWFVERATGGAKKALNLESENRKYQRLSKECYRLKAEISCADKEF